MAAKLPVLPADHIVVDPDTGKATDPYWLWFDALQRTVSTDGTGVTINGVQVTY